jgi:hypothetical protein
MVVKKDKIDVNVDDTTVKNYKKGADGNDKERRKGGISAFPEDEKTSASLVDDLSRRLDVERAMYEREWERYEQLGRLLTVDNGLMNNAIKSFTEEEPERLTIDARMVGTLARLRDNELQTPHDEITRHPLGLHALEGLQHQQTLMNKRTGALRDRITLRVPPFDLDWRYFKPDGARGTAARGPSVYKEHGSMFIDLTETYVDRPVAYGGWMRAGAGLGIWFKPKSTSTYVRVAPLVEYDYWWRNDSRLQVARNFGELCTRVLRRRGPDDFETLIDRKERLWNDSTGWYETHEGYDAGYWVNHDYFWGNSNEWYLIWVWCNGGIDFATKTLIGSSRANQSWNAKVRWVVFEQWA